jgi:myo-inositol-1(or 4)-monophosphatase
MVSLGAGKYRVVPAGPARVLARACIAASASCFPAGDEAGRAWTEPVVEAGESGDVRSIVTRADLESERVLLRHLVRAYACRTLSEESGARGADSSYRAVVDPLDGSINFARGALGLYAISAALEHEGRMIAGAIALPFFATMLTGEAGIGVFRCRYTGRRLVAVERLSPAARPASLEQARVIVGRGGAPGAAPATPPLSRIYPAVGEVLNFGSCATGLFSVAQGTIDALILPRQRLWDFAGGLTLIAETGGKLSARGADWRRAATARELARATETTRFHIVAAGSARLHDELVRLLVGN